MDEIIKDFDKLIPQKRIAILGGRKFDVSKIPTRLALEQAAFIDNVTKIKNQQEAFAKSLAIAVKVCNSASNPEGLFARLFKKRITVKWLIENTNIEQLIAFINFILEPINNPKTDDKEKKNQKLKQ